ncbi:MAG: O-antigen ligase family protein [Bacteroidota bacterium]|nr:O-antigen ligase family protein [Bacteroidota bacterium]
MLFLKRYYFLFVTASLIFIFSLITAIAVQNFWWLFIPFAWILIPVIFNYTVSFTERLFWLVLILLPLSTELMVTDSLGLDFPDEPLLILITGIFIVKLIYKPSLFPKHVLKRYLFFLLILHLLWIFICCFFSVDPILSIKFFLAKIWYVIPFVLLPQVIIKSQNDFKKIALSLLLPMLFVVLQALIRHSFYNFSFEGIKQVLDPFFRNHVNYSAMLVCLLAVLWCMRKLTPNNQFYSKLINAGIVIGITGLIFSFSRGAWSALVLGVLAGIIFHLKKMKIVLIGFAISFSVLIAWLFVNNNYLKFAPDYQHTIFHTDFSEHLQATVTLKDVSNAERFYRWVAAVNMIAEKPIAGFGPNNFYDNYKSFTRNQFKTWVSNNPDHSSVHNYFLLTALEQGVVGLILFAALFFGMILKTQQLYKQLHNNFYRTIALTTGIVLVMIGTVIFLSDLIETDKIGSLFWLSLGMIFILQEKLTEEQHSIATTDSQFSDIV